MNKHRLKLNYKQRGFPLLSILLKRFSVGDKVVIVPFSKDKTQMPDRRFFGKIGTVVQVNKSNSIRVEILGVVRRTRSKRTIVTSNLHLKLIESVTRPGFLEK